jgi:uncharacterized membrane protein YedE/YeeE
VKRLVFVAFGALFGFLLSRARASDYDAIRGMFLLTDLHLFGVIGVAVATAAIGLYLLRRSAARSLDGQPIQLSRKPYRKGVLAGGLIFGAGWALAGTCPGTALTQLGEGKLYALATIAGILAGTWLQEVRARGPRHSVAAPATSRS